MKNPSDIQNLKVEIIHWLTSVTDKETLSKILAIKSKNETVTLTPQQEEELGMRLNLYLQGDMKFKGWEETKESIRKRAKHAV